ncbi:MAG: LPS export ABC transporter ATP-binding protein, partial [Spirochaetes bacterium]|nr:LPS export ABC transporter ATP-binding protein [Spirochaetota bacterium]
MASRGTLSLEGLVKDFGRKHAVREVTFAMESGEIVGLLGPNGAGKTTVFYMVVGFIRPTSGKIYLDGKDISGLPMYRRARMGISYLPQEPSVFRKLSVEGNVAAIIETRKTLSRKEKRTLLDALLDELGIAHLRKQPAFTLSGGERRRTEIARSLAIEPKFLLLDEPFAGIDPITVSELKGIVQDMS